MSKNSNNKSIFSVHWAKSAVDRYLVTLRVQTKNGVLPTRPIDRTDTPPVGWDWSGNWMCFDPRSMPQQVGYWPGLVHQFVSLPVMSDEPDYVG